MNTSSYWYRWYTQNIPWRVQELHAATHDDPRGHQLNCKQCGYPLDYDELEYCKKHATTSYVHYIRRFLSYPSQIQIIQFAEIIVLSFYHFYASMSDDTEFKIYIYLDRFPNLNKIMKNPTRPHDLKNYKKMFGNLTFHVYSDVHPYPVTEGGIGKYIYPEDRHAVPMEIYVDTQVCFSIKDVKKEVAIYKSKEKITYGPLTEKIIKQTCNLEDHIQE